MGYFIEVQKNTNIYIEDIHPAGRKTILFLHGWPLSHKAYEYQFNALPKLGYRCIGMDTRGFGKSDKPWRDYSYNQLADDVRCVMEALQLKDIILAGHSMGGAIAIRYMSRHKGYGVSKLALFGAAAPSVTQRPDFPYGLSKETVTALIQTCYKDRPQMLQQVTDMFFFQYLTKPSAGWFMDIGLQASGWSTIACAETFRDESLFSNLKQIEVPTLILHGIHDKVCLFPLALFQKQEIPNAVLIPFQYSGHGLFWEEKDKFNQELTRFIEAKKI